MIGLCKKCYETKSVGSFFSNRADLGKHLTGFIAAYTDEQLLIEHISTDGYYDGFILIHMSDLMRLNLDGQYERKIGKLYSLRKQSHPIIPYQDNGFYVSIIDFAFTNKLIVSIELEYAIISGFILDFDETYVHLQVLDEYGMTDGETFILSENAISFAVDTSTEQNLRLLYFNS